MVYRRPARRGWSPLFTLLILGMIGAAVGLVGLLIWAQVKVRTSSTREPMLGPGTFSDAQNVVKFSVAEGWEVIVDESQTRVRRVDGTLPTYLVELKSVNAIYMVVNWNCPMLPELMPRAAQAAMPSEATITFTSVPCAENSAEPAYARMYFTLNDGSGNAVIVMGPVDGVTWVVARSEPFEGQASTDLVTAMTTTVTSARRQS